MRSTIASPSRRSGRTAATLAALIAVAIPWPCLANDYQALCDESTKCRVTLDNGLITAGDVSIPRERVLSWSLAGSGSKADARMGVARRLLSDLPGLLSLPGVPILPALIAPAATVHDYRYLIKHVDDSGDPVVTTIRFLNNVPANHFMMELAGFTGLSLGQENEELLATVKDLKAREDERNRVAARECREVLKPYDCSWSNYVEANESVRIWSTTHPQLVPAEKARLQAAD